MKCYLGGKYNQCCCVCKYHRPVTISRHAWEGPWKVEIMSAYRFACCPPTDIDRGISIPWPEHSLGCEFFVRREE